MKQIVSLLIAGLCIPAIAAPAPKNVIMVIGDGMGPAYTTAYRMYADDKSTPHIEQTVFDRLLVGMASTHPDLDTGYVTDSAAGATALSTGVKTYNGAIGVDVKKQPALTVLELAKEQGRRTGVAVTSQINHATPAGFSTHNESRHNYNEIADSYFDRKIKNKFVLDVMLGGGWSFFMREDRNLVDEFRRSGYQYIDKLEQLNSLERNKPLLGLFSDVGMPWALDSEGNTRLLKLSKAAIQQLENENGYFLLIEASQVDWAGHGNDIAAAMGEMHDLALTLEWLEEYIHKTPETLMVVTADHSTGGLTIGSNGVYDWEPEWLTSLKSSPGEIAKQLTVSKDRVGLASEMLGFELSYDEGKQLTAVRSEDFRPFHKVLTRILDERSKTGWTTGGHTGVDVPVFAMGMGSDKFRGHLDNTHIANTIFELLKNAEP